MLDFGSKASCFNVNVITDENYIYTYKLARSNKDSLFLNKGALLRGRLDNYFPLYNNESDLATAIHTLLSYDEDERLQFCSDEMLLHYIYLYIVSSGIIKEHRSQYIDSHPDVFIPLLASPCGIHHYAYMREQ